MKSSFTNSTWTRWAPTFRSPTVAFLSGLIGTILSTPGCTCWANTKQLFLSLPDKRTTVMVLRFPACRTTCREARLSRKREETIPWEETIPEGKEGEKGERGMEGMEGKDACSCGGIMGGCGCERGRRGSEGSRGSTVTLV